MISPPADPESHVARASTTTARPAAATAVSDGLLVAGLAVCLFLCVMLLILASPLLVVLRAAMPLLPGRWQAGARLVLVTAAYVATFECGALADVIGLRIHAAASTSATATDSDTPGTADTVADTTAAAADRHVARHERVILRRTAAFFGPGLRLAGVKSPPIPVPPDLRADRPVIVLSRHAGFVNAQLLIHVVGNVLGRRPHAIAKLAIRSDPAFGALLPHTNVHTFRWTGPGRVRALSKLIHMGRDAQPDQGFILFPEGTNFTADRRRRAIDRLRERGRHVRADQAEALAHTMPPVIAGARALVSAAPDADVLVFGHTGLEDLLSWCVDTTPGSADAAFHTAAWRYAAEDVPRDKPGFERWLGDAWRELDAWIASVRGTAPAEDDPSLTLTISGNRQRARRSSRSPWPDRSHRGSQR